MRRDVYQLMVLAIACHLPREEAYSLLNMDFIERFSGWYDRIPDTAEKPTAIDAMIKFTVVELPAIEDVAGDVRFTLGSQRDNIIDTFLNCSTTQMITKLASRSTIADMVRNYLRKENKQQAMYAKLNSSRVNEVFNDFLTEFELHCAYAFQFTGTFQDFVMNCFINFYYKGHKRDIWASIRQVDTVKREVEQSIVQEKIVAVKRTDDVLIHDLVLNINLLNHALFYHSGQSEDAHGVCYDTYYLLLCNLCERRVQAINESIGEDLLEFIDPLDRREARLNVKANKGVAAKIENAKELVPPVFEYVRSGKLNTSDLVELRDECFKLGKHDREGRNCPWKDVTKDGETSRYLDTMVAASNYSMFDMLVKGVVSVSTLMSELEARGMFLVDNYREDLFNDTNIVRYVDYLSSVQYLDLMRQLQEEPVDYNRYGQDLLEFSGMVDEYAGSAVNNHTNIRDNRYYAITHGFLDKPRLKQTTVLNTRYEKLRAMAKCFDSVPRSRRDYLMFIDDNKRAKFDGNFFIDLPSADVVGGRFTSLYTNVYITEKPDIARYYLRGDGVNKVMDLLDDLSWHVGTALYSMIKLGGMPGLYLPMRGEFMFCQQDQLVPVMSSLAGVFKEYRNSQGTLSLEGGHAVLPMCLDSRVMKQFDNGLENTVGFTYDVGLANLMSPGVQSRIAKMEMTDRERKYAENYFTMLNEMAHVQFSLISVMKVMMTEVMYWLHTAEGDARYASELRMSKALLKGMQTGEFNSQALEWMLRDIHDVHTLTDIVLEAGAAQQEVVVDRSVLDYCFGDGRPAYDDIAEIIAKAHGGPAEKFVTIYNYVYTKLEFLRYVRDAYSLAIDIAGIDASTLVCELTQRFGLDKKLQEYLESQVKAGIRTDMQEYAEVKQFIWLTRDSCLQEFKSVVDELVLYVKDCEQEIAKLVEYNISARRDMLSRFEEIGQAFNMLPSYPETTQLRELKGRARMDSSGFFMLGGSYFKGLNGGREYYVHRSGRMVMEEAGEFRTAEFDLEGSVEDMRKYQDILNSGLRAG